MDPNSFVHPDRVALLNISDEELPAVVYGHTACNAGRCAGECHEISVSGNGRRVGTARALELPLSAHTDESGGASLQIPNEDITDRIGVSCDQIIGVAAESDEAAVESHDPVRGRAVSAGCAVRIDTHKDRLACYQIADENIRRVVCVIRDKIASLALEHNEATVSRNRSETGISIPAIGILLIGADEGCLAGGNLNIIG